MQPLITQFMVSDCVAALKNVVVKAPFHIGDVVFKSVLNAEVNIIANKIVKVV